MALTQRSTEPPIVGAYPVLRGRRSDGTGQSEETLGHKVFISHSSKDAVAADRIVRDLEQHGIKCWISSKDINPGENFQDSIVSALENTSLVLLLLSKNANRSTQVKKELAIADNLQVSIIPVRIEECLPTGAIKYQATTRQYIDLFRNWDQNITRLADAIRNSMGLDAAHETTSRSRLLQQPDVAFHLNTQDLEKVSKDLAFFIGPIGMLHVTEAADSATSIAELYGIVAAHIENEQHKAAFLRKAPRWR